MPRFRKILITLSILSYVDFFGIINTDLEYRLGGLKLYDVFVLLIVAHLGFLAITSPVFRSKMLRRSATNTFISSYVLLVMCVAFSMKLRAPMELIDSFKIARDFFPLFLFFYIWYDIVVSGTLAFYEKLLKVLGIGFSLVFILTTLAPGFVGANFHGLTVKLVTSTGFKMPRTYGYGFVFPYLYFIYQYVQYFLTKKISYAQFFITFIGVSVQGFRSYFLGIFIVIFMINILFANRQRIINSLIGLFVLGSVIGIAATVIGGNFFEDKVMSIFTEVSGDEANGTYAGREQSDQMFRLPLLMKHPWFGIGFVHGECTYAESLGSIYKDRNYMLYSTDSGLVTMGVMFGFAGGAIILFLVLRYLYYLFRAVRGSPDTKFQQFAMTGFCYLMLLLVTLKTHGGLIYIYGLTPLVFLAGMLAGYQSLLKLADKYNPEMTAPPQAFPATAPSFE